MASTARGAGAALRPTLGSRGCRVFNLERGDKASARPVLCPGCPLEGASAEEEGRLSPELVPHTDRGREAWTPPTTFLMQELKRTCSRFAPRGHSAQKRGVGRSSGFKKKKKRHSEERNADRTGFKDMKNRKIQVREESRTQWGWMRGPGFGRSYELEPPLMFLGNNSTCWKTKTKTRIETKKQSPSRLIPIFVKIQVSRKRLSQTKILVSVCFLKNAWIIQLGSFPYVFICNVIVRSIFQKVLL